MDATMPIIGGPQVPATTLVAWLDKRAAARPWQERSSIVCAYCAYGELLRVGNLFPFAQAWHETGGFTSDRWIKAFNPAGLGATNDGAWGATFATPAAGIIAHYAHLLAYAADDSVLDLPQRTIVRLDPRLVALVGGHLRGVAPQWLELNGRWAVPGTTYAQRVAEIATQIKDAA